MLMSHSCTAAPTTSIDKLKKALVVEGAVSRARVGKLLRDYDPLVKTGEDGGFTVEKIVSWQSMVSYHLIPFFAIRL